uniref:Uncharacterized protein n=1 Tax=Physcomitrium patens TaxID=3218 RepID=A0A2K1JC30_PHYPA|nr:hypothetical protein PHYPA_019359 [Physcomitrium patens]
MGIIRPAAPWPARFLFCRCFPSCTTSNNINCENSENNRKLWRLEHLRPTQTFAPESG